MSATAQGPDPRALRKVFTSFGALQVALLAGLLLIVPVAGISYSTRAGRAIAWTAIVPAGLAAAALVYYLRVTRAAREGRYSRDLDARELKRALRGLWIGGIVWALGLGVVLYL